MNQINHKVRIRLNSIDAPKIIPMLAGESHPMSCGSKLKPKNSTNLGRLEPGNETKYYLELKRFTISVCLKMS